MKFWRVLLSMPALVAGGYVLASMLWIVFSDRLVLWLAGGDLDRVAAMQTWKGLGFVVATGVDERVIARHHGWIRIESVPEEGTLVQFAVGGRS